MKEGKKYIGKILTASSSNYVVPTPSTVSKSIEFLEQTITFQILYADQVEKIYLLLCLRVCPRLINLYSEMFTICQFYITYKHLIYADHCSFIRSQLKFYYSYNKKYLFSSASG